MNSQSTSRTEKLHHLFPGSLICKIRLPERQCPPDIANVNFVHPLSNSSLRPKTRSWRCSLSITRTTRTWTRRTTHSKIYQNIKSKCCQFGKLAWEEPALYGWLAPGVCIQLLSFKKYWQSCLTLWFYNFAELYHIQDSSLDFHSVKLSTPTQNTPTKKYEDKETKYFWSRPSFLSKSLSKPEFDTKDQPSHLWIWSNNLICIIVDLLCL